MSAGPSKLMPRKFTIGGASARALSASKIDFSTAVVARPARRHVAALRLHPTPREAQRQRFAELGRCGRRPERLEKRSRRAHPALDVETDGVGVGKGADRDLAGLAKPLEKLVNDDGDRAVG